MIFSVCNDSFEWSLHFGPDSVTDCKRSRPINENKFPRFSSGSLELVVVSETTVLEQTSSESSIYHNTARNTKNEGRSTFKCMCTRRFGHNGYQVSADLDDVEFYWENDQLDVDAVMSIDTPCSSTAFDELEMGGSAENPFMLDEEEDKEKSPPITTPVSERPTRTPALLKSGPFGKRKEKFPDYVYRNLLQ